MEHLKILILIVISSSHIDCRPNFGKGTVIIEEEITDVPVTAVHNKEQTFPVPDSEPKGSPIDSPQETVQTNDVMINNGNLAQDEYQLKEIPNLIQTQIGYNGEIIESSNEEDAQLLQDRLLKPAKNKVCFDASILKSNSKVGSILRKIISRDLQAEIMEVRVEEMGHSRKKK
ncbi:UNVERIFIED_CONTAM: hypothetical protein RMT77_003335 [Armadillidium vulgare]